MRLAPVIVNRREKGIEGDDELDAAREPARRVTESWRRRSSSRRARRPAANAAQFKTIYLELEINRSSPSRCTGSTPRIEPGERAGRSPHDLHIIIGSNVAAADARRRAFQARSDEPLARCTPWPGARRMSDEGHRARGPEKPLRAASCRRKISAGLSGPKSPRSGGLVPVHGDPDKPGIFARPPNTTSARRTMRTCTTALGGSRPPIGKGLISLA